MTPLSPRLLWGAERQARNLAAIKAQAARDERRRMAVLLGLAFTFSAVATYVAGGSL